MFHGYAAYQPFNIMLRLIIMLVIAFLIDLYLLRSVRFLTSGYKLALIRKGAPRFHKLFFVSFASVLLFIIPFLWQLCRNSQVYHFIFLINTLFILIYLPKFILAFCQLIHDALALTLYLSNRYSKRKLVSSYHQRKFFIKAGLVLSILISFLILSGILIFRNQVKVEKYLIKSDIIPDSFDYYRIVQLSDLHLGTMHIHTLRKTVDKINQLNPDLVVMTGDLVSFHPDEINPFLEILRDIKAKDGKFSVLGNHDYGDYLYCIDSLNRQKLITLLIRHQQDAGIIPLRNEHIFIKRQKDSFMLAGIENWSIPPYHVYGDIRKTLGNNEDFPMIVLLSHDPRHWQYQIKDSFNIFLTLSGHTHGGQFGFYTHLLKWSPIEKITKYWGGHYVENDKNMIVNKGLGVIGFLGRIGIRPEISLIVFKSSRKLIREEPKN